MPSIGLLSLPDNEPLFGGNRFSENVGNKLGMHENVHDSYFDNYSENIISRRMSLH
jgi:hypothetical protein